MIYIYIYTKTTSLDRDHMDRLAVHQKGPQEDRDRYCCHFLFYFRHQACERVHHCSGRCQDGRPWPGQVLLLQDGGGGVAGGDAILHVAREDTREGVRELKMMEVSFHCPLPWGNIPLP